MGNWARQARQALSQKEYMRAGDFFKLDGNYRAAVKAYVKGGIFGKAVMYRVTAEPEDTIVKKRFMHHVECPQGAGVCHPEIRPLAQAEACLHKTGQ